MDVHQAVITCNLGDFDRGLKHAEQSVKYDYFDYNDKNFPLRDRTMTSRLQAKIPKCFGWQLAPGYDSYLWIDGNLRLKDKYALEYFQDQLVGYDVVVLKHPKRDTLYWEYRYNYRGLHNNAPSNYLTERYTNEWLDEQYKVVTDDKDYKDDMLVNGGIFMYRNTPEVQAMFKEWWYHITRYLIMDQISWSYVLKKSGLKINVRPDEFNNCRWLENRRHKIHG